VRLGVVTTSYPRFDGDPAGNFVAGHVGALRSLGHTVEVIAAGDPRIAQPAGAHRIASRLFYRGGAPDAVERSAVLAGPAAAAFTARLTCAVASRAPGWDAIIAHWLVPSALAALPGSRPLLAIAHGGDVYTLARFGLLGLALGALHRRGARLAFVSEPLRGVARAAAPRLDRWLAAAAIQPMGIDVARFAALDRAPSDPPTVLVVARLVPIKGVDVAIAAMPHVARPARLVIAGDGPERARLAASPGRHELVGEIATDRRDALLRTASVVVIPSRVVSRGPGGRGRPSGRTEGTPLIALEALAAGVPVIASAVGGLAELAGIHRVPPDDPRALAAAIERILAAPPTAAALRATVTHLDWREVAARLLRE
jgi:glycosyltransferase involved in cell wall biosynthesis